MNSFLQIDVVEPSFKPETAWLEHGAFAMWLVKKMWPGKIVELGTHWGYSYFAFCEDVVQAGLSTQCVAVDTWDGDVHAGEYDEQVYENVLAENQKYAKFSTLLRKTFDEALADVEDGSIDLLHVDGRHFYNDVKHDYESWIPKLSERAVVMFHDTMVRKRGFGVYRYWAELAEKHPAFNFIHGHGLGVLFYGDSVAPELSELVSLSEAKGGPGVIEDFFKMAGSVTAERLHLRNQIEAKQAELSAANGALAAVRGETETLARAVERETESLSAELAGAGEQLSRQDQRALALEADLQAVTASAQKLAHKAEKAERRPMQMLLRRIRSRAAKVALAFPFIRNGSSGPNLRKTVEKYDPSRFRTMIADRRSAPEPKDRSDTQA